MGRGGGQSRSILYGSVVPSRSGGASLVQEQEEKSRFIVGLLDDTSADDGAKQRLSEALVEARCRVRIRVGTPILIDPTPQFDNGTPATLDVEQVVEPEYIFPAHISPTGREVRARARWLGQDHLYREVDLAEVEVFTRIEFTDLPSRFDLPVRSG